MPKMLHDKSFQGFKDKSKMQVAQIVSTTTWHLPLAERPQTSRQYASHQAANTTLPHSIGDEHNAFDTKHSTERR